VNLLDQLRQRWQPGATRPDGFDPFAGLYAHGNRPINGEFETADASLDAIAERVLKRSPIVWACQRTRMEVFSEVRFQWQQMRNGRPGDLFGNADLAILESPWIGGTTGDLLARMCQDVDLMGNAFVIRVNGHLRRLRPDWITAIYGSHDEPELFGDALDGELVGYFYTPRMPGGTFGEGEFLFPNEVAHFAPYPDPQAYHRGMSWITPVLREIEADDAAVAHKGAFFRNGAVPKMAMKVDPSISKPKFEALVAAMDKAHSGPWNAYKTLYVGGGADPVPMTFNMRDLDYSVVLTSSESRVAAAAGVPGVIVGFVDGTKGTTAFLGTNTYDAALKRFVDLTMRPLWRNAAASLEVLFEVPTGSRLWYDERDVAFMQDNIKEAAEVRSSHAATIRSLIDAGFDPEAAVQAVRTGDFTALDGKHTGLFSVQLQPPLSGEIQPDGKAGGADPATPPADNGQEGTTA
jgi:phage portal protein BeeE